jgi:hypothetical protein
MLMRTREHTWTFGKPFMLKGVGRELPAGSYRVATDEELIEGLSFPVYRRVATMIFAPGRNRASLEMLPSIRGTCRPRRSGMPRRAPSRPSSRTPDRRASRMPSPAGLLMITGAGWRQ